jgi:UDP-N-acetylglucosamine--N-acetylmuramyl-(pentapeptide) pyrophosphoryl-undecaprenol N-acetylglucosamine transferase
VTFLFVCGGTAGHINPALGIATEMRSRIPESKILFVGADRELEKKLIPGAGFHLVNIKMSGLRRGFSPDDIKKNLKTIKNLATASVESANLLRRFQPDAVIGTGGYICYPVMKKAAKMGIPTFIHEPNAHPGLAVRMLSAYVDKVLVTFPGMEEYYRRPERVIFSGTPLRDGFYANRDSADEKKQRDRPLVVSFWGSLGAGPMNEMMTEFIRLNTESKLFDHIHATGKNCMPGMRERLKRHRVSEIGAPYADIREYIDDMPSVMNDADLMICRAGASTIAELTAMGKPAILIPSPYVADNHQEENAKRLLEAGGVLMYREKDCTGEMLYRTTSALLADKPALERMALAQKSHAVPNAASKIVDIVISDTGGRERGTST